MRAHDRHPARCGCRAGQSGRLRFCFALKAPVLALLAQPRLLLGQAAHAEPDAGQPLLGFAPPRLSHNPRSATCQRGTGVQTGIRPGRLRRDAAAAHFWDAAGEREPDGAGTAISLGSFPSAAPPSSASSSIQRARCGPRTSSASRVRSPTSRTSGRPSRPGSRPSAHTGRSSTKPHPPGGAPSRLPPTSRAERSVRAHGRSWTGTRRGRATEDVNPADSWARPCWSCAPRRAAS
jgi:hypothetical protein